jgi:hypothetical protein
MEKESLIDSSKLREGNIGLILDSYDDIFSDFDPRPYTLKGISDDFLQECRKASYDKEENIGLRLFVPRKLRRHSDEIKIKKRLKEHFHKHFKQEEREIRKIKRHGTIWFFLGVIIISIATFLFNYEGPLFNFLIIILEPAGWFFMWEGLGKIFIYSKEKMHNYNFYKKMVHSEISFFDY